MPIKKEDFKYVEKLWGEEIILVNSDKYCAKLLVIDPGARMSYHYHIKKTETFYCLEGYSTLRSEGKDYLLAPFTRPKTIAAGTKHMVLGHDAPCVVLEVSTNDNSDDSVREVCSKAGY